MLLSACCCIYALLRSPVPMAVLCLSRLTLHYSILREKAAPEDFTHWADMIHIDTPCILNFLPWDDLCRYRSDTVFKHITRA